MHTIMGSIDSNLSVEKAAKKIYEKDLNGACLTEHSSIWEKNNNQIEDIFNLYTTLHMHILKNLPNPHYQINNNKYFK